ncbi:MAG: nitroreductase [candidate division Zixibacteria bacterium SM23_81]|nr:MAG: nitroreductase [candidate division Zixibacteria bacterium SM23_81]
MPKPQFVPLMTYHEHPVEEMKQRAAAFYNEMQRRRTVRHFSNRSLPREIIEQCLRAASTAPSGANMQPWHFVVVEDQTVKRRIRLAAEVEEREFYRHRAPEEWLEALAPLGTNEHKQFLETAPYVIAVFVRRHGKLPGGYRVKYYYPLKSVGIATGILITAIHHAGLVALTYTPSRIRFLNDILHRPADERPFLLLVVGYPSKDAVVPDVRRKVLAEIATFV